MEKIEHEITLTSNDLVHEHVVRTRKSTLLPAVSKTIAKNDLQHQSTDSAQHKGAEKSTDREIEYLIKDTRNA